MSCRWAPENRPDIPCGRASVTLAGCGKPRAMIALSLTNSSEAGWPYRTPEITQFVGPGNIGLPADCSNNLLEDLAAEFARTKTFDHVYRSSSCPSDLANANARDESPMRAATLRNCLCRDNSDVAAAFAHPVWPTSLI